MPWKGDAEQGALMLNAVFCVFDGALDSHMLLELDSSLLCLLPQRPYSQCICHISRLETAQSPVPAGAVSSLPLLLMQPRGCDS